MTDPRLPEPVEKTNAGYRRVQDQTVKLRRSGYIPYGWISDATRRGYHVDTFRDRGDFLRRVASLYRAELWSAAAHYVEVWCESRSIAGVIEDDCRELAVSLYPCGGFASLSLVHHAAEAISHHCSTRGVPAEIIYIGDHDPAGVLIDKKVESEFWEHLDDSITVNLHRIAINADQIDKFNLPSRPRKPGEKRAQHIVKNVEAESLPAPIMRQLLRNKIESFLPAGALEVAKAAEESERFDLLQLANTL